MRIRSKAGAKSCITARQRSCASLRRHRADAHVGPRLRASGIPIICIPAARSFRSDGVELSALSPQLRRIAIEVRGNISPVRGRGWDHVKANPKSIRIRCAYCSASARRRRHRAGQYCPSGGLSCCAELDRSSGEALVLPIGLGNSEIVLVLACTQPSGATSRCAGDIGAGVSLHSTPPPSGPAPAGDGVPMSLTSGETAPPPPHVKKLAVKPMPAPVLSATDDKSAQQGGQEENTARPIPEVPAPRGNTASQTSAQAAAPPPVAWPDAPLVKAPDAIVVPTNNDAEATARGREPTNNTGTPMRIFPLFGLGLAAAGILWRVVIKNAAARRAQIIVDHAEPGIVDDQLQREGLDDQGRHEPVHERHALISAVSDHGPAERAFQITHEIIKRKDKLAASRHEDLDRLLQAPGRPHDQRQSEPAAC